MIKRLLSVFLMLAIAVGCIPSYAFASEIQDENTVFDEIPGDSQLDEYAQEALALAANGEYTTIIMQGNTQSASDCRTFRTGLLDSGNGYNSFALYGWDTTSDQPKKIRVNSSQVKAMKYYDVAYYSGHGGTKDGGVSYPVINYIPSNSANNYGTSDPINVAQLFKVNTDNWRNDALLSTENPLRVLVLAACSQLDSSIVKYYARMMKASGIRAIAGYHDTAPAAGDDRIATNFINYAAAGNSVWYSWQHANSGYNWAVLVYQENANQYYRLPGFPGKQYTDPSSSAKVYRYASFLSNPQATPTALDASDATQIDTLPLTITTSTGEARAYSANSMEREITNSDAPVSDDCTVVQNYLRENITEDVLNDSICVEHYVSREEIDEDYGALEDSAMVVERTYDYYDTYAGIKIADSYVGASIDAQGIKNIVDERKCVVSAGESALQARENSARSINLISESDAIAIAQEADQCGCQFNVLGVSLAYAPVNEGEHVLCYEVVSSHGFHYVSVESGEIINLS